MCVCVCVCVILLFNEISYQNIATKKKIIKFCGNLLLKWKRSDRNGLNRFLHFLLNFHFWLLNKNKYLTGWIPETDSQWNFSTQISQFKTPSNYFLRLVNILVQSTSEQNIFWNKEAKSHLFSLFEIKNRNWISFQNNCFKFSLFNH